MTLQGQSSRVADAVRPLSGLRVVELSSYVATPLCGLTLAQLGADVIRVEPMGGAPDRTRWPLTEAGRSLYWTGLNRGKRALEVDLRQAEGRALVADLVASGGPGGGIVVSNSERYADLNFAGLAARRPDLIHVQLLGRRDGGTAVDYTAQAAAGMPLATGPTGLEGPVNHVLPAWDVATGLYLATAVLAAVQARARDGSAQQVRVALEDVAFAVTSTLGYFAEAQLQPKATRVPDGNYVYGTFGRDFVTGDGERLMIVALTPRHWNELVGMTALTEVMDALERSLKVDFSDEGVRFEHRESLATLLAGWFIRHRGADVRASLSSTTIIWSRYRSFSELASDDARELRANPLFAAVSQDGVPAHWAAGGPIVVNSAEAPPLPAPDVGEHTCQLLAELSLAPAYVDALAARGLIRQPGPQRSRTATPTESGI